MRELPIAPNTHRIPCLDALRGFALLGIFLSIINGYNLSLPFADSFEVLHTDRLSRWWTQLHELLIAQRFIAIFSLLFGVGIAIQRANFKNRNLPFLPFFLRRMLMLGLFGLINTTFFWWGEILLAYAVYGLLLIVFFNASWRVLVTAAVLVYVVIHPVWVVHFSGEFTAWVRGAFYETYQLEDLFRIYREGSAGEMMAARWREYAALFTVNDQWMRTSLSLMLIGYGLGKYHYLRTWILTISERHKWLILSVCISVVFSLIAWQTGIFYVTLQDGTALVVANSIWLLASTYFYIHAFVCLYERTALRSLLSIFGQVGRMSVTNYMLGACLYAFIYHNQGFSLYAKLPEWTEFPIALGAYASCTVFSCWWLKRFRFGPMEWVWRSFSYWKRQPMIR